MGGELGTPVAQEERDTARTAPFVRFDLRVDKTAIWNDLNHYSDLAHRLVPETRVP
jgi:hypothetical protein